MILVIPPPEGKNLPVIEKISQTYKLWHEYMPHFHKTSRYTLGAKIDSLFILLMEYVFLAKNLNGNEKILSLKRASLKLDLLKFFLRISWEIKSLDSKKYITISEKLDEIGKMLGGWIKQSSK